MWTLLRFRSRPSAVSGSAVPPPGMWSAPASEPSVKMRVERMPRPSPLAGPRTTAPAPSPKRTQVVRSFQFEEAREELDADDEHAARLAGGDELIGDGDAVDEAGAGRGDVERRDVVGAELLLHVAGAARASACRR